LNSIGARLPAPEAQLMADKDFGLSSVIELSNFIRFYVNKLDIEFMFNHFIVQINNIKKVFLACPYLNCEVNSELLISGE